MEKQWFAFSGRVHVDRVILKLALVSLLFLPIFNQPAHADLNSHKEELPSYDLDQSILQTQKKELKVGDRIELQLHLPQAGVTLSTQEKESGQTAKESEANEVKEWLLEAPHPSGGNLTFNAIPLKSGDVLFPSLVLKDQEGRVIGQTRSFSVHVQSSIQKSDPNPTQPSPMEPPVGLKFPLVMVILISVLALIVFGAIIYLIYRLIKKYRSKKKNISLKFETADQVALQALSDLQKLKLIEQGRYKEFYFRISEIVKIYLGARYKFDAPESTTYELITILKVQKYLSDSHLEQTERIFTQLDLVKFTDIVPLPEQASGMLLAARQLITNTRIVHSNIPTAAENRPEGN